MTIDDKAIDYVLGTLSAPEREEVSRERLYNADLDKEIGLAERLYARLQPEASDDQVSSGMWNRISTALQTEQDALAGKYIEDCVSGNWQEHGPRIEFKPLWSDAAILIRCNPGAVEDSHDQPLDQDEHILVIAGELDVGGRIFGTGDYIRVPAGSIHMRMSTRSGCILFTEYVSVH
jgi:ChrR Cupin-like domain